MRGLTLIVASADAARYRSALTLACAQAALGGRARLFHDDAAVTLLATGPLDATLAQARAMDVKLIVCQTALDAHGLTIGDLHEGSEGGGMISLLATIEDDRLVFV
ncbi:DsrE family protein [Sphingomonas baiyangensis]|uniref:Peroxiredoxin n=1 Tax=Sphingomonas baiyangensis TaxID=2572576 RepID=A0A4U1L2E8_9SPHN|nr:DsrE family protein [Sphingomonas baiyangensis]TKD51047.1 peroxiredoxin [Sphingomonas baiyangensis]